MPRHLPEGSERLRRRPEHHLRRHGRGRLPGQRLEIGRQGHLHEPADPARARLPRADQAAGLSGAPPVAEAAALPARAGIGLELARARELLADPRPLLLERLLPVAYDRPTLDPVAAPIDPVQEVLGRRMLLENPATYLRFQSSAIDEVEFLTELPRRTG